MTCSVGKNCIVNVCALRPVTYMYFDMYCTVFCCVYVATYCSYSLGIGSLLSCGNICLVFIWLQTDSRPQIDLSKFDMDEAEAANIILGLSQGNSRSCTPCQSSVPHSPRSQSKTPSPAFFGSHRPQTFIPISKFSGSLQGTPTPWSSGTPLSGRSSIEITSPGVPKYSSSATPTLLFWLWV